MPYLARLGDRVSHLLHSFVYSFPSNSSSPHQPQPQNQALAPPTPTPGYKTVYPGAAAGRAVSLMDVLDETGDGHPLVAGVGPLSFLGSGYGVTLILTALLLNRIHHIVRRPRQPAPAPAPQLTAYRRFRASLAVVLTDPSTPQYLRLPGLAALLRAWVLFSVLLLQVANLWPDKAVAEGGGVWRAAVLGVGRWAGDMEMDRVCWQVLLSVCVGLVCGGLATGLDPVRRRDLGAGFNLFGYSFLLHLYSSPLTHQHPSGGTSHGRPDVHALFQLWLSLGELTWLQAIELSPRWRRNLLLPTGVCGSLGLVHFVYAITTTPLKFPSFTFLTHLLLGSLTISHQLALFLSIVIVFTVVLRAFTLLFTQGYIPSLASLLPHEGVVPNVEDDFGVTLLKIGTACIEATHLSGLRNELASLQEHKSPWLEMSATGSQVHRGVLAGVPTPGFHTEITEIEVSELPDGADESTYWREFRKLVRACVVTLVFCTMWLVMATPVGRKGLQWGRIAWRSRWWYGPRGWRVWRRAEWEEPPEAKARRLIAQVIELEMENARLVKRRQDEIKKKKGKQGDATMSRTRLSRPGTSSPFASRATSRAGSPAVGSSNSTLQVPYGQFLLGNDELEAEEDDDEWQEDGGSDGSSVSGAGEDEYEYEPDPEPGAVYRDLIVTELEDDDSAATTDLQPVLLAHLTSRATSPLTRRRYASLIAGTGVASAPEDRGAMSPSTRGQSSAAMLREVMQERREAMRGTTLDEDDEETRRTCVVCLVQQRDTVLWPCRCLALCDDCRESLATRLSAPNHMCPCCRRKVEGYSRIYIP